MVSNSRRGVWLYLFILGFSSLFTQIYLLREFLVVYNGNELVIGIVLANWMLLTGLGAFLGRWYPAIKGRAGFLVFLQFIFAVLPLLMILKLDFWRAWVLPYGSMAGLVQIVWSSLLVQAPFCLINGFLFSALFSLLSETVKDDPGGRSYAVESLGSMAAGMIVNFVLLWFMEPYQSLRILLWLNLAGTILFSLWFLRKAALVAVIPLAVVLAILPLLADLGDMTGNLMFRDQERVYDRTTPYGRVTVTRDAGQLNFYENGLLLFSSGNEIQNEEAVHFVMIQHPDPKSVLLIGGGITGKIDEILKYQPERIDYAELNPAVIEAGRTFYTLAENKRVRVLSGDGRQLLRTGCDRYDVALICLPEPSTIQINRFYTVEFFRELRQHLNPGGVVSLSLASTADYVSPVEASLNSVLYHSLNTVFRNVMILPGQKNYFIASDRMLTSSVATQVSARKIKTLYVNPYYFDDQLLADRSGFIRSKLLPDAPLNHDYRPVAFFYQVRYWTEFFHANYLLLAGVVLVILVLALLSLNTVSQGLFISGFTVSSLELFTLLAYQVIFGYVFSAIGLLVSVFMAGLFAGSWFRRRIWKEATVRHFLHLQLTLALFCIGFPFVILAMNAPGFPVAAIQAFFLLLIFAAACITGLQFSAGAALNRQPPVNSLAGSYSADLFGSALGAVLTVFILLPFLGLTGSCLAFAAVNFLSAGILFIRRKKVVTL